MYHNITAIISSSSSTNEADGPTLLQDMQKYWLPNYGTLEHFWAHEWNKHGTCINTLNPGCYGEGYEAGDEVVDFFTQAVALFQKLDTYKALAAAGIVPSTTATYSKTDIQKALTAITGHEVILGCRGNALNQAWYSFNVKGSLQGGEFMASEPVGKMGRGGCPERGIRYLPK